MEQEFEFIKGYENLYMINRNGEIKSCGKGMIMKQQETDDGYLWVKLTKYVNGEKERKKCYIHRLVGIQYLDNPDNKPEIDHIDRNTKNNLLDNLRWVCKKENRRNRPDIIENLTEEQKEERLDKIRQYKKEWAENNRREKGCKIKSEMNLTKDPEYYAKKSKERRAKETPEQKELRLLKRRERYKLNNINEKQREYLSNPEVKERRRLQQIERRKQNKLEN